MRHAASYDAELRRHNEVLRQAVGIQLHDHVLDIGCGTGQTSRQAARTARAGSALGVDISAPAIKRAREPARAEGLRNVTFEHADAQVHRFRRSASTWRSAGRHDVLRLPRRRVRQHRAGPAPGRAPGDEVWQARERNEWDVAIHQSTGASTAN
jgi:SAM-dependent methyltransferase